MKYLIIRRLNFFTLFLSLFDFSLSFLEACFIFSSSFSPHIIVPNPVLSFSVSLQLQALADEQAWVSLGYSSDSCSQLSAPCCEHVTVLHKAPAAHLHFAAQYIRRSWCQSKFFSYIRIWLTDFELLLSEPLVCPTVMRGRTNIVAGLVKQHFNIMQNRVGFEFRKMFINQYHLSVIQIT